MFDPKIRLSQFEALLGNTSAVFGIKGYFFSHNCLLKWQIYCTCMFLYDVYVVLHVVQSVNVLYENEGQGLWKQTLSSITVHKEMVNRAQWLNEVILIDACYLSCLHLQTAEDSWTLRCSCGVFYTYSECFTVSVTASGSESHQRQEPRAVTHRQWTMKTNFTSDQQRAYSWEEDGRQEEAKKFRWGRQVNKNQNDRQADQISLKLTLDAEAISGLSGQKDTVDP